MTTKRNPRSFQLSQIPSVVQKEPWAVALLARNDLVIHEVKSRRMEGKNDRDLFWCQLLTQPQTLEATIVLRPRKLGPSFPRVQETLTIFALGKLLSGHPKIAHGGVVATLLDEALGVLINVNVDIEQEIDKSWVFSNIMTGYLNTAYRKPVPAPGVILIRTWLVKREGRKTVLKGTIEDGKRTVLAESEALFIDLKEVKL